MLGFVDRQADPDREQVALRDDVLAGVLDRADHDDADRAALGSSSDRAESIRFFMVRSLIQAVSAASSSISSTISGSPTVGVWRRVTPHQPVGAAAHHVDGVLEQLRRGRLS